MQHAHFREDVMSTRKPASRSTGEAGDTGETMPAAKDTRRDTPHVEPDQQPARLDDCRRCALWSRATQAVGGVGPKHAPIMMVGEQPGDKEDLQGMPFVGPAGQLLDDALSEAGVDRRDVYVTNAVKHFKWEPRGKRRMHKTPAQREIDACRYWLERELASVGPRVLVALGATALKAILEDRDARLQAVVGKVLEHGGRHVVPTYHPSFALRAPDEATRHRAYAAIVAALREAGKLAQREAARESDT
ncbi:UdgX family uracil-DNA binding protein [Paraburkholderia sp. Tr-20389]|uniref:UdgX family uracil-DNA binding protein n=1 Tax=Paraburkholderia sp. Tr-20389 TaxID=2703903 RepID=UPI00197E51FA|nr:UdgX family uracil-DNA binding protein [Paraburkholderia sp. Tr-20389]MBN3757758.1 UdgX family uracil-DNA binding protein [Paraburkholderia sp. Tr-20389]